MNDWSLADYYRSLEGAEQEGVGRSLEGAEQEGVGRSVEGAEQEGVGHATNPNPKMSNLKT